MRDMNSRTWQHCFPMHCKVNIVEKRFFFFACTPPFLVHEDFEQFLARLSFYCTHVFLAFCIRMAAQCADSRAPVDG